MSGLNRLRQAGQNAGKRYGFHSKLDCFISDGEGNRIQDGQMWVYRDVVGVREKFLTRLWPGCQIPYLDDPALDDLPVTVMKFGEDPQLWIVGSISEEGAQATGGVSVMQQWIAAAGSPQVAMMADFRLEADDEASTFVWMNFGWYYRPGGDLAWFGRDRIDLSTLIAALSTGQHQMIVVSLDTLTGDLATSAATATTGTLMEEFDAVTLDAIEIPPSYLPGGAVHIYKDQASIVENDIYRTVDPRVVFSASPAAVLDRILSDANGDVLTDADGNVIYA